MVITYSRTNRAKPMPTTLLAQRIVQRIQAGLSELAENLMRTAEADSYHQLSAHVLASAPLQVTDSIQSFRQAKALQQLAAALPGLLPMSVVFEQQEAVPHFVEFFNRQIGASTSSIQQDIKALLEHGALENAQHPLRQKIQKELYSMFAYKQALSQVSNAVHLAIAESRGSEPATKRVDNN